MSDEEWFRRWFGEEYLSLYPHRDREEARRAVQLLLEHVPWRTEWRALDLACGAGRHLRELRGEGLRAVGLDLSESLLRRSRSAAPSPPVVRGDMRYIPFPDGTFHLITSFFTSFGYFAQEGDDRRVLREVRSRLRPDGRFFLDFLNASEVARTLRPREVREMEGRRITQERRLSDDGRIVEKRIRIEKGGGKRGGSEQSFVERVRLYRPDELEGLFREAGLSPELRFGDYDGAPLQGTSPRCIILGRAV